MKMADHITMLDCRNDLPSMSGWITTKQHPSRNNFWVTDGLIRFDHPDQVGQDVYDQVAQELQELTNRHIILGWEEMLEKTGQIE